jgi:hypothetical protein
MRRSANTCSKVLSLGALALAISAVTSCAAPEPPANPAWDTDVYPILRGNCLHCHGTEFATTAPPTWRFDVCNVATFMDKVGVGTGEGAGLGAVGALSFLKLDLTPNASTGRPKMPPPPAEPLPDYEQQIMLNWVANAMNNPDSACKKASPNQKPQVRLVSSRKDGNTVWATLEISDPDGDQVMGKATAGNGSANLLFVGRKEVKIENASSDKISVKVFDGWDTVETTLN